jgi:hypothetical protein
MVSDPEFDWIERQAEDGGFQHLVVATSMPWLLPRALHDIESLNEALCAGSRGHALARMNESLRRALDLEHWAAFRRSFDRLARFFERVGRGGQGGAAPATICLLSGDVHHSYISEADYRNPLQTRVFQVTSSPIHNTIPFVMRLVFNVGWSNTFEGIVRFLARWAGVPRLPIHWHHPSGPHFGNTLASLTFDAGSVNVRLERATWTEPSDGGETHPDIRIIEELSLMDLPRVLM